MTSIYIYYIEDKSHWFRVSSSSSNARAQGFSSSTFSMEEYHTESQNDLLAGYLNKVYDTKLTHIKRKVNSVVICILPSQELNKEKHSSASWEISQSDISHLSCCFSHREYLSGDNVLCAVQVIRRILDVFYYFKTCQNI